MPTLSTRIYPEALRSLAFGSISGTYAAIGTAFANPIRILKIYNGTDANVTFSWDGITDHEILPTSGFVLLDLTSNKTKDDGAFASQGTTIYAKGTVSSGSVYVSAYYGKGL